MNKVKIVAASVLAVLVVIVILQNMDQVTSDVLFWSVPMPRAVLLFVTLVIGFVVGLLTAGRMTKKKKPS